MKIGFIGLGNVGGKLAGSLQRNGFELTVRDLDRSVAQPFLDRGALWAESPKAVAEASDVIFTIVGFPRDARAAFGITQQIDNARPGVDAIALRIQRQATDADSLGQLEVRRSVADYGRMLQIDVRFSEESRQQSCTRFSAFASVVGDVGTNKYFIE